MAYWQKLDEEKAEQAASMYKRGLSCGQIADFFGVTRQSMHKMLVRRGVSMRTQIRRGKENHFYRGGPMSAGAAHDLVEQAVAAGVIVRPARCSACAQEPAPMADGRSSVQAHHDDYSKPLDVRWLCQLCHHEWHKHNTPEGAECG